MTEIQNNQKYDLEERTAKFGEDTRGQAWIPSSDGMTSSRNSKVKSQNAKLQSKI